MSLYAEGISSSRADGPIRQPGLALHLLGEVLDREGRLGLGTAVATSRAVRAGVVAERTSLALHDV